MALVKGGDSFLGHVVIDFNLKQKTKKMAANGCLFIDYKGRNIRSYKVNGTPISNKSVFAQQRIQVPAALQNVGANTIEIFFESEFVTDCAGIHYFKDTDNSEYIYSELEPANSHIWFPCFDQPDLKAPYKMVVLAPKDWKVISTCAEVEHNPENLETVFKLDKVTMGSMKTFFGDKEHHIIEFAESVPISTYIYSMVAGPFDCILPKNECPELKNVPLRLFCRKGLTQYVKKFSEDWFHVTRKGILYYQKTFDVAYPFDKLDQIFCPDYNMGAMENVGCILYRDEYVPKD
jgi:aminopeptidase N